MLPEQTAQIAWTLREKIKSAYQVCGSDELRILLPQLKLQNSNDNAAILIQHANQYMALYLRKMPDNSVLAFVIDPQGNPLDSPPTIDFVDSLINHFGQNINIVLSNTAWLAKNKPGSDVLAIEALNYCAQNGEILCQNLQKLAPASNANDNNDSNVKYLKPNEMPEGLEQAVEAQLKKIAPKKSSLSSIWKQDKSHIVREDVIDEASQYYAKKSREVSLENQSADFLHSMMEWQGINEQMLFPLVEAKPIYSFKLLDSNTLQLTFHSANQFHYGNSALQAKDLHPDLKVTRDDTQHTITFNAKNNVALRNAFASLTQEKSKWILFQQGHSPHLALHYLATEALEVLDTALIQREVRVVGGLGLDRVNTSLKYFLQNRNDVYVITEHYNREMQKDLPTAALAAKNSGYQYAVFSFAINDLHQVAVVIDFTNNKIMQIDSKNIDNLSALKNIFSKEEAFSKFDYEKVAPHSPQSDQWSCGVHVVRNALTQLKELTPEDFKSDLTTEVRRILRAAHIGAEAGYKLQGQKDREKNIINTLLKHSALEDAFKKKLDAARKKPNFTLSDYIKEIEKEGKKDFSFRLLEACLACSFLTEMNDEKLLDYTITTLVNIAPSLEAVSKLPSQIQRNIIPSFNTTIETVIDSLPSQYQKRKELNQILATYFKTKVWPPDIQNMIDFYKKNPKYNSLANESYDFCVCYLLAEKIINFEVEQLNADLGLQSELKQRSIIEQKRAESIDEYLAQIRKNCIPEAESLIELLRTDALTTRNIPLKTLTPDEWGILLSIFAIEETDSFLPVWQKAYSEYFGFSRQTPFFLYIISQIYNSLSPKQTSILLASFDKLIVDIKDLFLYLKHSSPEVQFELLKKFHDKIKTQKEFKSVWACIFGKEIERKFLQLWEDKIQSALDFIMILEFTDKRLDIVKTHYTKIQTEEEFSQVISSLNTPERENFFKFLMLKIIEPGELDAVQRKRFAKFYIKFDTYGISPLLYKKNSIGIILGYANDLPEQERLKFAIKNISLITNIDELLFTAGKFKDNDVHLRFLEKAYATKNVIKKPSDLTAVLKFLEPSQRLPFIFSCYDFIEPDVGLIEIKNLLETDEQQQLTQFLRNKVHNAKTLAIHLSFVEQHERLNNVIEFSDKVKSIEELELLSRSLVKDDFYKFIEQTKNNISPGYLFGITLHYQPESSRHQFILDNIDEIKDTDELVFILKKFDNDSQTKLINSIPNLENKIKSAVDIGSLIPFILKKEKLNFAIKYSNFLTRGRDLFYVALRLDTPDRFPFLKTYADRIGVKALLDISSIIPRNQYLELIALCLDSIHSVKEYDLLKEKFSPTDAVKLLETMKSNIKNGYLLYIILENTDTWNKRFDIAIKNIDKIKTADELALVMSMFDKDYQMSEQLIKAIPELDNLITNIDDLATVLKIKMMPITELILRHQNKIQNVDDLITIKRNISYYYFVNLLKSNPNLQNKIATAGDLAKVIFYLDYENRLEFAINYFDRIQLGTELKKITEVLFRGDVEKFLHFLITQMTNGKMLAMILHVLPEHERFDFAIKHADKIQSDDELELVKKEIDENYQQGFVAIVKNNIANGTELAATLPHLPSAHIPTFLTNNRKKILNNDELIAVANQLDEKARLKFIKSLTQLESCLSNGKHLAAICNILPEEQRLPFATNYKIKVKDGEELALVLEKLKETDRIQYAETLENKVKTTEGLAAVLKVLPKNSKKSFEDKLKNRVQPKKETTIKIGPSVAKPTPSVVKIVKPIAKQTTEAPAKKSLTPAKQTVTSVKKTEAPAKLTRAPAQQTKTSAPPVKKIQPTPSVKRTQTHANFFASKNSNVNTIKKQTTEETTTNKNQPTTPKTSSQK